MNDIAPVRPQAATPIIAVPAALTQLPGIETTQAKPPTL